MPRRPAHYSIDYGSELRRRGKQAAVRILEMAEDDPEKLIDGVERFAQGIAQLYVSVQQDPQAKRTVRNALVSALAGAAKRKLT